ncbi:uromodulin-like 1 [Bufo bufo]|uniref:uromodulin-like 1 n=1 Tax=Bufo bufo TaxID=8384 RepID=UPI001ABEC38D|nr:uromodulin-like 1 [Bufo bufo]
MISPWSYHVCNQTVTVNVSKVIAFQKAREEPTWCMSWIPWKLCTRTSYHIEYRTVYVPETSVVKRCCEGYEPVGHYCALSVQTSHDCASRPGTCPAKEDKEQGPKCTFDYDCPGLQKCCISPNGSFCASPAPPVLDRNTIKYWYNATAIIKMAYEELIRWDEGLVNHTRLLHSMVTGEFWPLESVVYHISTKPSGTFSIASSILIGINESLPLRHLAAMLNNIVIRLPEVFNMEIHDVDECLYPALGSCLSNQECVNLEGSYNCTNKSYTDAIHTTIPPAPSPKNHPSDPPHVTSPITQSMTYPGSTATFCNCSMFHNHSVSNVTSSGFHIQWNTDCPENYTYNIYISSKGSHDSKTIKGTTTEIHGLQSGELYTVQVTFQDCNGMVQLWKGRVKTEAHIVNVTLKIENWNLTESLMNPNSTEHADFIQKFILEVKNSLSNEIPTGRVMVEVESLSAGSIIVHFRVIVNDSDDPVNITAESFSAFSEQFEVNPESIVVTDLNECLSPADNDCHLYAVCKDLDRSYTCECHPSFVDRDPRRPGRNCEGGGPTSESLDSSSVDHVSPLSPSMENIDPTAGGSTVSPADPSPPTTSSHPGHLTNVTENSSKIIPSAAVSGDPHPAKVIQSTPVPTGNPTLGPVHSTPDPVLTTSLKTVPSNLAPTVNNATAKVYSPVVGALPQLKATEPPTTEGIVNVVPTATRQTTSREISCSFPVVGANVASTNTPHLETSGVKTTAQKSLALTLKDASTVICAIEKIGISIDKAFLKMMSIVSQSLFLGSRECSIKCSTDTHIFIEAGWKDCNTDVNSNKTHIMVNSTLYIDLSTTSLNVTPRAVSSIRCMFHNEILWSSGYNPSGGIYSLIEKLEGDGTFTPEFQLFIGDQPIPPNFTLSATDEITVQISIKTEESQFKVVISDCWATPTDNANDPRSFPFIKDSCALSNTFTTIHTNGISNNATFQSKIFSFVENPIVYLHCRLQVCTEEPLKTCKPTCNGFRSARTGDVVFTDVTRIGPLQRSAQSYDQGSSPNGTLGPGYIALVVIGVLVLVAMVVSILICWHERRTGNYSFKIKTPDVGYQVFSN